MKIAVVVRDDLATWQKLNVTAFLASGVAGGRPESVGEDYADADGVGYLPMFGIPVLVYAADATGLAIAHRVARERSVAMAVFTEDLFSTGNDVDNRATVAATPTEKLALVGVSLYGPRKDVDRAVKGLALHP